MGCGKEAAYIFVAKHDCCGYADDDAFLYGFCSEFSEFVVSIPEEFGFFIWAVAGYSFKAYDFFGLHFFCHVCYVVGNFEFESFCVEEGVEDDYVVFFVVEYCHGADEVVFVDCYCCWEFCVDEFSDEFGFEVVDEEFCCDCAYESESGESFDDGGFFRCFFEDDFHSGFEGEGYLKVWVWLRVCVLNWIPFCIYPT